MRHARAEIITLMINENLCLVLQLAKGPGMQNPVTVTLKGSARQQGRYVSIGYSGVFSVFAARVFAARVFAARIRLIELTPTTGWPMAGIGGKVSCLVG